jgi:muramoyltetrapeptide carboxypeptidase LdcA involved in peptidoglycan recycling
MFITYDNLQVRSVDLNKLDFNKGADKVVIKIIGGDGVVDIMTKLNNYLHLIKYLTIFAG